MLVDQPLKIIFLWPLRFSRLRRFSFLFSDSRFSVQNFTWAFQLFMAIRSKFFMSRSAVYGYPFEIFHELSSRSWLSVQNFSWAIQLFSFIRSKLFMSHSPVQAHPFQTAWWPVSHPFLTHFSLISQPLPDSRSPNSRAFHPFERTAVLYVFAWEVTKI